MPFNLKNVLLLQIEKISEQKLYIAVDKLCKYGII
jgi:hypothetical protein